MRSTHTHLKIEILSNKPEQLHRKNMRLFGPPDIEKLKARGNIEGLRKVLLQEKQATLRREAAKALGSIGGEEAAQALIQALEDPDEAVRREVFLRLQEIGKDAAASLAIRLMRALPETRETIQQLLLRIGEPAVDELVSVLRIDDQALREVVGPLLVRFGEATVAPLAWVAQDENRMNGERVAAIRVLGNLGEPAVAPLIIVLNQERTKKAVQEATVNALGQIGRPALKSLVELEQQKGLQYEIWAAVRYAREQIESHSRPLEDQAVEQKPLDQALQPSKEAATDHQPQPKLEISQPAPGAPHPARQPATRWDTVRIFISSTFDDMHAERDYLIKQVFPELREWCEKRKLRLVDIDLRWGVKEEDTQNKNVVEVCLRRIDEARPFFLCFLGQRRGWVPQEGDISDTTLADNAYPDLRGSLGKSSVTEMEILHALVNPFHASRIRREQPAEYYEPARFALFYLRDPSYLEQLPRDFPALRMIFTNAGLETAKERDEAQRELEKWTEQKIPDLCAQYNRPIRNYTARWNPSASTPELLLPLACPSTELKMIENWQRKWRDAWKDDAGNDTGIHITGTMIAEPQMVERANQYNHRLSSGRLTGFECDGNHLSQIILGDLQAAIRERYPEHMEIGEGNDLQKELDQQEQFLFTGSESFIKRGGDFDALDAYVAGDSRQLFVLTAPGGMGKTTLLAKWVDRYLTQSNAQTSQSLHFRFIGQSDRSTTVYALLSLLLRELKEVAGKLPEEIPADPQALRQEFPKLLECAGKRGKIILVLDALNQLESGLSDLAWLPYRLPEGVKLVVSFQRDEDLVQRMRGQVKLSEVRPFENLDHRRELVEEYLKQYLKQLDQRLLEAIIQLPGASNPLYLKVVLSELRIFGAFANLGEKIRSDFGETPVSAFNSVLARLESDPAYTSIAPQEAIPLLFGLLAHTRHGLSTEELAALFIQGRNVEETPLEWNTAADTIHLFLRQVRPFLARRDGRYDFYFESFRTAALKRYVTEDSAASLPQRQTRDWHRLLADYFAGLPTWKTRPAPAGRQPTERKVAELPFHQTKGELWAELGQTLGDLTFMDAKCAAGMLYGLIDDYNLALSAKELPQVQAECFQKHTSFLRSQSHILSRTPYLCFQQAANAPEDSQLERAANQLISEGSQPRPWLRWINKPVSAPIQLATLAGHTDAVTMCTFSGDHTKILSGSMDGTLKLWDAGSGRELCTYAGHPGSIRTAAISPDGKRVISASVRSGPVMEDKAGDLHLWGAETGIRLALLLDRHCPVRTCAFSPDGHEMAAGLQDGSVRVWNALTAEPLFTLTGHTEDVMGCAFSPDGTELVTVSRDHTMRRWDALTGGVVSIQAAQLDRKHSVWGMPFAFSRDTTRLITGIRVDRDYSNSMLAIWDVSSAEQLATLSGHPAQVNACAFSPDGNWVATGSGSGESRPIHDKIKLWKVATGEELVTFTSHNGPVHCCAFSPNGETLVTGADDGALRLWDANIGHARLAVLKQFQDQWRADMAESRPRRPGLRASSDDLLARDQAAGLTPHTAQIWNCAFSPDSRQVVSASKDGSLRIWDAQTGRILAALVGHRGDVLACAFASAGQRIVSGGLDGKVKIWDAEDGALLKTPGEFLFSAFTCAVSPDSHWIVAGSGDTTMKLWDAESWIEKATLYGHKAGVTTCVFSPDSRRLASACGMVHGLEEDYDPDVKIWDTQTGTELVTLKGGGNVVHDCRFSPDGQSVVAASGDGLLRLWNLEYPAAPMILQGHHGEVYACPFSPDGRFIASASEDGTVKVWDAKTGSEVATLSNHTGPVTTCGFSRDGTLLGSASQDGSLRLWGVTRASEVSAFWVEKPIGVLTWAPDGHSIAAGDNDGGVYLLRLE